MNPNNDLNYYKIIQTKDRGKMYRYKLIQTIVEKLDNNLEENNIDTLNNETMLLRYINHLFNQLSPEMFRYFNLFGGPKFKQQINIYDIQDWIFKYKKKKRLYSNNDQWTYGL
jgi:hypothetical protein